MSKEIFSVSVDNLILDQEERNQNWIRIHQKIRNIITDFESVKLYFINIRLLKMGCFYNEMLFLGV